MSDKDQIMQTREQWGVAAVQTITHEIVGPEYGTSIYPKIRVSIAMLASKTLGECYPKSRSADGHNEIFIAAHCDDSMQHLATLVHEVIHAFDDCDSAHNGAQAHRGRFAKTATAVGLEGKMTATSAGVSLTARLADILSFIGPIPHSKISKEAKDKGNRNGYKLVCNDCGFKANTSRKWADQISDYFDCPVCRSTNTEMLRK